MMQDWWLVSYLALWILVILEGVIIVALARQIGNVLVRLGPAGARMMNAGPNIGDIAPPLDTKDLEGNFVVLGSDIGKKTLLVFVSPSCPSCAELIPSLRTLHRTEQSTLNIVLVSDEDDINENIRFISKYNLQGLPLIASNKLAASYRISTIPYALVIDSEQKIRAKGLVNHYSHLESLLNAEESGIATLPKLISTGEIGQLKSNQPS